MQWQRWKMPGLLLVVVAAVVALAWWKLSSLAPDKLRLPNDKEFTLRKISYGKAHRFAVGKPWQRMLAEFLPTNVSAALHIPIIQRTNEQDTLVCWIETRPFHELQQVPTLSIVDAQGHESAIQVFPSLGSYPVGDSRISGYSMPNFPRRSKYFFVRAYDSDSGIGASTFPQINKRGEYVQFKVRNPARGNYPNWRAETLPIARKAGTEEFTLTAFNTGLFATGLVAQQGGPAFTEIAIDIKSSQPCRYAWRLNQVLVSDASGNLASTFMGQVVAQTGQRYTQVMTNGHLCLAGHLWLDEPAWRVRVEFVPEIFQNPCAEDLWKIKVPVPSENSFSEMQTNTHLRSGSISVLGVAGAHFSYTGEFPATNPVLWVKLAPTTNTLRLLRCYDEAGKSVRTRAGDIGGEGIRSFSLFPPSETKSLDLTFLLYHHATVEFVAKPSLLRTNIYRPAPRAME